MNERPTPPQKMVVRAAKPQPEPPPVAQYIVMPQRSPLVRFLRIAISLLLLLAAGYGVYSIASPLLGRGAGATDDASTDPTAALEAHRREALEAEARRKVERQAMLKERMKATLDRGERLRKRAMELGTEATAWEKKVVPLLTNEEGKYLSAERHWVDSFEESYRAERPSYAAADEVISRLDILLEPIQQAWDASDWSTAPGGSLDDRLSELERDIDEQIEAAKAPRMKIESLLLAAKDEGAKGERTLEEAMQFYKAQAEARAATVARRAKQKAEDETDEALRREQEMEAQQAEQLKVKKAEKERQLAELRTLLEDGKTKLRACSIFCVRVAGNIIC
jgi:hypothetical protein